MSLKDLFFQNLNENSATLRSGMNTGDIRWEGNKCYKFVKYNPGSDVDLVAGDVLCYKNEKSDEVTFDISETGGCGAGVVVNNLDLSVEGASNVAYIWIQIKGPATVSVALGASTDSTPVAAYDGGPLIPDTAVDKALRQMNTLTDAAGDAKAVCAHAVDASAKTIICDFPF